MKKIFHISALLSACLVLGISSCDKVESPYSTVSSSIDTVAYPPPSYTINSSAPRKVLVEDYTGHTCGNCPNGALILHNLVNSNPNILGLSVHCGVTFASPAPPKYPKDWRTEVGTAFDNEFGVSSAGQPNGMINRKEISGSKIHFYNVWANEANNILNADPIADIELKITAYYVESSRKLISYVHAGFIENISPEVKLGLYIVEDSIVAPQKWYGQSLPQDYVEAYVHDHMLRKHVSPIWGVSLGSDNSAGTIKRNQWSITLPSDYNDNHVKLLAIAFNSYTKEIIQVEEVHIK